MLADYLQRDAERTSGLEDGDEVDPKQFRALDLDRHYPTCLPRQWIRARRHFGTSKRHKETARRHEVNKASSPGLCAASRFHMGLGDDNCQLP